MAPPQLIHELGDQRITALADQQLSLLRLRTARAPVEPPVAESEEDRKSPDAGLGQTEARTLTRARRRRG